MTALLVAIASILFITAVVWLLRRLTGLALCPICMGVGGTWLWMLLARAMGFVVDVTLLGILLGGSVAGIAYLVEKRLPAGRSALWWKTLFIPLGFMAAYALAISNWLWSAPALLALVLLTVFFLRPTGAEAEVSETVDALKKKMQQCC